MNFSLADPPKINKDYILSKLNQYDIFSFYFGCNIQPKKLYVSNIRKDKKPTVGFYINKQGNLIYHDFGSGEFYNCFSYVMRLYNVTYFEALKIISSDFKLNNFKIKHDKKQYYNLEKFEGDKQTFIQIEMKDYTEPELKWWNSFGISRDVLHRFKVYSCKTVFLNGNIYAQSAQHSPIYGYYFGKKDGAEQWRIYMPKRKEFRFIGNVPTKTIQGYKQLPKNGKLLVITKSMKDVMCLYSLGISAIAPNSETQFVSDKVLEELKQRFTHVVLLYDNDLTGVRFTNKIRKLHPELIVSLIPRSTGAKDISDYYHAYGRDSTINLIKNAITYFKNEKIDKHKCNCKVS